MTIPYLDFYGSINNGAHRQAAELIGAPAFIWHQALWRKAALSKKSENKTEQGKTEPDQPDPHGTYINAVFAAIGKISGSDCHVDDEILVKSDDRAKVISFSFNWEKMRAKIRFEIHTEYITITSIVDCAMRLFNSIPEGGLIEKVQSNIEKFIVGTCPTQENEDPEIVDIDEVRKFIYHDIWEANFFPQILNVNDKISEGIIGKKFADFRGFITCETYPPVGLREQEENLTEEQYRNQLIQEPFYRTEEGVRNQWQRTSAPSRKWARYRLNNVWKFLDKNPEGKPLFLTRRTEFTVSRILGGRALYVTALGPQPKQGIKGHEQPLYFYLHSSTRCEREIGRTVDRIMQLGTLRLAAIVALPHLKEVRTKLKRLETSISGARAKTHELIQFTKLPENRKKHYKQNVEVQEKGILSLLDEIQNMMATLSNGTDPDLGRYLGDETLEYRLIRSRYYKSNFFSLMGGLRIRRLEGYQPYDEFIERRLGSAFGFIEGVEQRIEQIKDEWRALDQLYLTTTVTILTGEIDKQQEETQNIQTTIEDIQIWGELILIGFLIPYYFSSMAFHLLNCDKAPWCSDYAPNHYSVEQKITFFVWIFAIVFAVGKAIFNKKKVRNRKLQLKKPAVNQALEQLLQAEAVEGRRGLARRIRFPFHRKG